MPKAKYLPIGISVPKGAVAIPLPRGKYALVDEDDADRVMQYNWSLTSYGYAYNSHKIGFMHRFIMNTPSDMVVDHINHDPLDNRKANLRNCTHQQNILNSNPKRGGTSVYRGVHRHRESWVAHIHLNDTTYHLGTFKEEVEAARAYDKASKELHKQFGRLNFPDE